MNFINQYFLPFFSWKRLHMATTVDGQVSVRQIVQFAHNFSRQNARKNTKINPFNDFFPIFSELNGGNRNTMYLILSKSIL